VEAGWDADRRLLQAHGFEIRVVRERRSFVEAEIRKQGETVLLQWARDSAYRFFPLVRHPDFGLALHPFDLATNKVLALVGRLEVRDWVDLIHASDRLQPLGYLAWAACGKDPGFSPAGILEQAAPSTSYSATRERSSPATLPASARRSLAEGSCFIPAASAGQCPSSRHLPEHGVQSAARASATSAGDRTSTAGMPMARAPSTFAGVSSKKRIRSSGTPIAAAMASNAARSGLRRPSSHDTKTLRKLFSTSA